MDSSIIEEIEKIAEKLKESLNSEVDIEFCVDGDGILTILQCRPVTFKKKEKYFINDKSLKGEWVLQAEMPFPFTPLVLSLDPSGLFASRKNKVINNFVYFKSDSISNAKSKKKNWKNWENIQTYYTTNFDTALNSQFDLTLLEKVVSDYRELVSIYMNIEWFKYRKKIYTKLIEKLKEKDPQNYYTIFLSIIRNIDSINSKKRIDFIELLDTNDEEKFSELKDMFLYKYAFETSHPFYINGNCLEDYFDELIFLAKNRVLQYVEKNEEKLSNAKFGEDKEIMALVDEYKMIVKRTEDDDYLLCKGAYVIRKILVDLGEQIGIASELVFFLDYSEFKKIVKGKKKAPLQELERRKELFEKMTTLSMPIKIIDGKSVFEDQQNAHKILKGTIVSPGKTTGQVYVLKNSNDIFEIMNIPNGSIVYSSCISPALSSYFFNIKGFILSEKSLLSHGAILAREMCIPAVGGIQYPFNEGNMVEINGDLGEINLL